MGHSILVLKDRHAIFHDSELSLLIGLMAAEVASCGSGYLAISATIVDADNERRRAGPGALELDLGHILAPSLAHEQFFALLNAVEARVRSFGTGIPCDVTQTLERVVGVTYSADYPAEYLLDALARLRALVKGGNI